MTRSERHHAPGERFGEFQGDVVDLARRLLGVRLVRDLRGVRTAGIIVETEAYLGEPDKAAHTYGGRRTERTRSMYLPAGHAYVYRIYGLHACLNVVAGERDVGVAVLVRALQPTEGLEAMFQRRPKARRETDLCSGPAKLTQAMAIDRGLDGTDLRSSRELFLETTADAPVSSEAILVGPRVGVGYAAEWARKPLRFSVRNNPHVSPAKGGR